MRVLIVDDASFIRDMIKKHLREHFAGADLVDAVDGNRAIAALKSGPVDLILSDWEMPGVSGEEFLRWVRHEESHKNTPFVMVTSRGDRDHVMKAVQAGVSDYLTKPFTPDELIRKVTKQLQKAGINPSLKANATSSSGGRAAGSVEALTGGSTDRIVTQPKARAASQQASGTIASAYSTARKLNRNNQRNMPAAKAQLRFAKGNFACLVKDISLQALNGTIQRAQNLPGLFDPAVVDIITNDGQDIAQLNGFVHTLQAVDDNVKTESVKVIVQFVDNDPAKVEFLSKYIAKRH